jgi:hypothetical protein
MAGHSAQDSKMEKRELPLDPGRGSGHFTANPEAERAVL